PGPGTHHRGHRPRAGDLAGGRPFARRQPRGVVPPGRGGLVPTHPAAAGRRRHRRAAVAAGAGRRPAGPPGAEPERHRVLGRAVPDQDLGGERMSRQRISPARRRGAVAVLLAVVLLVAGCASLPRSGRVTASDPDLPAPQPVGFLARGPQPGASPEEIVDGFLAASAAGYSDDFVVARTFLTGAAADTWQPLAQVRVYDEEPELTRSDDGGVHLSVGAAASVDGAGRYTEASEDATIDADFTLARNARGEWRIAGLDDG